MNIGGAVLPETVESIAFLDSDIGFSLEEDWVGKTLKYLERFDVVQMFEKVYIYGKYNIGYTTPGVESCLQDQSSLPKKGLLKGHTGFAWAFRRSAIEAVGLPEYAVVGGGDMELACALLEVPERVKLDKSDAQWRVYKSWADEVKQRHFSYSSVPMTLWHLWHGDEDKRNYVSRNKILIDASYDPMYDLYRTPSCMLELTDRGLRMQEDISRYFRSRIAHI
jgi:hypothetical protein